MSGSPSYCYKALRPYITSATIDSDSSKITLIFNTTVKLTSTWSSADWRLEYYDFEVYHSSYYDSTLVTYSVSGNGTNTIVLDVTYNNQLFGFDMEYFVLTFIDRYTTVDTTYSLEMINTQFTFTLQGKEKDSNASEFETMGTVALYIFGAVAVVLIGAGLLGYKTFGI